ncbi:MAG: hypothetical protein O3A84_08770 [Proteobacteria bacterium]|nr:hypothetical protein [Pseudomonadota bacterium]
MLNLAHRLVLPGVLGIVLFAGLWYAADRTYMQLGNPKILTGWSLFGLMIFLALFNTRKKLAAFNLGRAKTWLALHVAGGVLAVAVFLFHTGTLWPLGAYEQFLTALFWLVSLTGILGLAIITVYPRRLTDSGLEIIYERVPAEISEIRQLAEAEVIACTEEAGQPTLSDHYEETMDWYFRRPRFFINHLVGGVQAAAWIRSQGDAVRRYLSDKEAPYLDRLLALAERKAIVDKHYACQDVMRKWLVAHIPLSVALIGMSVWHLLLIHVYSQ